MMPKRRNQCRVSIAPTTIAIILVSAVWGTFFGSIISRRPAPKTEWLIPPSWPVPNSRIGCNEVNTMIRRHFEFLKRTDADFEAKYTSAMAKYATGSVLNVNPWDYGNGI